MCELSSWLRPKEERLPSPPKTLSRSLSPRVPLSARPLCFGDFSLFFGAFFLSPLSLSPSLFSLSLVYSGFEAMGPAPVFAAMAGYADTF